MPHRFAHTLKKIIALKYKDKNTHIYTHRAYRVIFIFQHSEKHVETGPFCENLESLRLREEKTERKRVKWEKGA